jgi:glycine cleavage system pyridoxal-binding protein P
MDKKPFIHPYIPNSVPEVKKKMLEEIGVGSIDELYEDIPPGLRFGRELDLPEPLLSELELKRHVEGILAKNIACGDIQGLGNHMYFGGSVGGFIASRDEEQFVMEYPSRLFGITKTSVPGEWGFGDVAYSRTSFDGREKGKEFIGTAAALYGISAAVYLSLMGPRGMRKHGKPVRP